MQKQAIVLLDPQDFSAEDFKIIYVHQGQEAVIFTLQSYFMLAVTVCSPFPEVSH